MERRFKRKFAVLAVYFIMILFFCIRVMGAKVLMLAGLGIIGMLMIHIVNQQRRGFI